MDEATQQDAQVVEAVDSTEIEDRNGTSEGGDDDEDDNAQQEEAETKSDDGAPQAAEAEAGAEINAEENETSSSPAEPADEVESQGSDGEDEGLAASGMPGEVTAEENEDDAEASGGLAQKHAYNKALESKIKSVEFENRKWAGSLEVLMRERNKPVNVHDIPNTKEARKELGRVRSVITAACEEIKTLRKVEAEKDAAIAMLHEEIQRLREQVFVLKSVPASSSGAAGGSVAAKSAHTDPEDSYIIKYMNTLRNDHDEQVPVTVAVTKYPDRPSAAALLPSKQSPRRAKEGVRSSSTLFFKQPGDRHLLAAAKRFRHKAEDITRVFIEDASRVSDAGITALASIFTALECFEVTLSNKVTDDGITTIANSCPKLKVLNLSYCNNIGNAALKTLGRCAVFLLLLFSVSFLLKERFCCQLLLSRLLLFVCTYWLVYFFP